MIVHLFTLILLSNIIFTVSSRTELKLNNKTIRDSIKYLKSHNTTEDPKFGPKESWDTSEITEMSSLFQYNIFNIDISQWDVSHVTNMKNMFHNATYFNGNLDTWDTSNVNNMYHMFYNANSFNGNLSTWNVSNVQNMGYMFQHASLFNGNLHNWNVSKVTNMNWMFWNAESFNQKLHWDIYHVLYKMSMFTDSPGSLSPSCSNVISFYKSREFQIVSSLGNIHKSSWCLVPWKNILRIGTQVVISKCNSQGKSQFWKSDYEGKLHNMANSFLCLEKLGKRITLQPCQDGHWNQTWRYTLNLRLISKRGNKGITVVSNSVESKNDKYVRLLTHKDYVPRKSETWILRSVLNNRRDSLTSLVKLGITFFQIVSSLNTNDKRWCLYPREMKLNNNKSISPSNDKPIISMTDCSEADIFYWTMDNQGKIRNSYDTTKCMTRVGKQIRLHRCRHYTNLSQRWTYDRMTNHLSSEGNGQVTILLEEEEASFTSQVKSRSLTSEDVNTNHYCQRLWLLEN